MPAGFQLPIGSCPHFETSAKKLLVITGQRVGFGGHFSIYQECGHMIFPLEAVLILKLRRRSFLSSLAKGSDLGDTSQYIKNADI
jgi:hypothetical protein